MKSTIATNKLNLYLFLFCVFVAPTGTVFAGTCQEPKDPSHIPDIALEEIASGFNKPVHIAHAGDGSGRLFVVEQAGRVRIIDGAKVLTKPFIDIRERVKSGGEKGLLSIAFHPHYQDNGLFYLNYTADRHGLETVISQFKRRSTNSADGNSEQILLRFKQPHGNHNGGQLAFGPEGYLYIGTGDGGSANDPHNNGQNVNTLLGKFLRIDVDNRSKKHGYGIPLDNPFLGKRGHREEIWAIGLRNPWRFSFDPETSLLYAADVGQNAVEEIDIIEKGGNYGWRVMEGDICTPAVNKRCQPKKEFIPPIHTYEHPMGFSITGGFVYRGENINNLCGTYVFADYVTQIVWGLRYDGKTVTAVKELFNPKKTFYDKVMHRLRNADLKVSSFGEGQDNELYIAAHTSGKILKIISAE